MSSVLSKEFFTIRLQNCTLNVMKHWKNTVRRLDSYRDNTVKRSLFFKQSERLSTAASKVSRASITYPYQCRRLSILTKTFKKVTFKSLQFIKGTGTYWKPIISPQKTPNIHIKVTALNIKMSLQMCFIFCLWMIYEGMQEGHISHQGIGNDTLNLWLAGHWFKFYTSSCDRVLLSSCGSFIT